MTISERLRIFWHLHFLQVLWNFKGMQHFGCLAALRPVLRRLWAGADYLEAEKRHALYFNTHPYFASICFGVVVKLEEELKAGTFAKPEMIPVLKNRMSGPLAAVGDAYYWETLRPLLASFAVLAVYLFSPGSPLAAWSVALLVCLYIFSVELMRWQGISWGYRHGLAVVDLLKRKDFQSSMKRIRNVGAMMLGMAATLFLFQKGFPESLPSPRVAARLVVLGLLVVAGVKKLSPTTLLYGAAVAGFVTEALA